MFLLVAAFSLLVLRPPRVVSSVKAHFRLPLLLRSLLLASIYVPWVGSLLILSPIRLRYLRLLPFLLSLTLLLRVPVFRSNTRMANHTYICMLSSLRSTLFPARCANSILEQSIPIFKLPSVPTPFVSTSTRRTLLLTSVTSLATTGSRLALTRRAL